jgi:hypothetical protein
VEQIHVLTVARAWWSGMNTRATVPQVICFLTSLTIAKKVIIYFKNKIHQQEN